MDELIGLFGVDGIGDDPMFESTDVIKSVIAHLMPICNNLIIEVVIAQHILTHHKERGSHVIAAKRLKNKGCRPGDGAIVEREINCMLAFVHSPSRTGIKPAQPFCRLFYKHGCAVFLFPFLYGHIAAFLAIIDELILENLLGLFR